MLILDPACPLKENLLISLWVSGLYYQPWAWEHAGLSDLWIRSLAETITAVSVICLKFLNFLPPKLLYFTKVPLLRKMPLHRGKSVWLFRQAEVKSLQEKLCCFTVKDSQEHFSQSSLRGNDKSAVGILPIRPGTSSTVSLRAVDVEVLKAKLKTLLSIKLGPREPIEHTVSELFILISPFHSRSTMFSQQSCHTVRIQNPNNSFTLRCKRGYHIHFLCEP